MPTRGIPQSFGLLLVFGLLAAGIFALVGYAIDKGADRNTLEAKAVSTEAAAAGWDSGLFCIPEGQESDPSLALLDRPPETCAEAEPLPIELEPDEANALAETANPSRGEELYFANNCQTCHGDTGQGLVGPTIAQTGLDIHGALSQYRQPRGVMPEQEPDDVPAQAIADIWAWLQTQTPPDPLIDPNNDALGHENLGQFAR